MLITVTGNLVKYLSLKVHENDRDKVKNGNGEEGIPQRVWNIKTTDRERFWMVEQVNMARFHSNIWVSSAEIEFDRLLKAIYCSNSFYWSLSWC